MGKRTRKRKKNLGIASLVKVQKRTELFKSIGISRRIARTNLLQACCNVQAQMFEGGRKRWNWIDRARAYDTHLDRIERDALSRERLAMKKRMARQGIDMQTAAADGLAELQRLIKRKKRPVRLNASDIARLAEVGGKLERYARGDDEEPNGTFEIRVRIEDPPADNAEDLAAAKAAVQTALRGR